MAVPLSLLVASNSRFFGTTICSQVEVLRRIQFRRFGLTLSIQHALVRGYEQTSPNDQSDLLQAQPKAVYIDLLLLPPKVVALVQLPKTVALHQPTVFLEMWEVAGRLVVPKPDYLSMPILLE